MFTGIVKGKGKISAISRTPGLVRLAICMPTALMQDLEIGASVAIDGVCLTVTKSNQQQAEFDVMQETLNRTTLGTLSEGAEVNIERAAKDGAEVGGHPISGHIDCIATVMAISTPENNHVVTFSVAPEWNKYLFSKGYVALNGTSLTVSNVDRKNNSFEVWLIPETLRVTTFGSKKVGDKINLEIERSTQVMVDTVRSYLDEKFAKLIPNIQKLLDQ